MNLPRYNQVRPDSLRRILALSYYHAPLENPGTRRIGAFVRYLPAYGYHPVVLTAASYGALDDDEARQVFRAPDLLDIGRWLARKFTRSAAGSSPRGNGPILTSDSLISMALEHVLIPDMHIGWMPGAVLHGRTLLRSGTFHAIFSSSPPPTAHLAGLALKRASGLPWVADFRDGWTFEPPNKVVLNSAARRSIERVLERVVVLNADRIVTVNDVLAADLRRRYPVRADRVRVISNGYDPAERPTARLRRDDGRFLIVHTGALAHSRDHTTIDGLLAALHQLCRQHEALIERLDICFVGDLSENERALINASNLHMCVRTMGPLSHQDALQIQVDADVLLLVTATNAVSVTTSKIFEYLVSGRPILALTGHTAAAALIEELDAGMVVAPDDVGAICRALDVFYQRWQAGQLPTRVDERVRRYDRRILSGELAAIFDELDVRS